MCPIGDGVDSTGAFHRVLMDANGKQYITGTVTVSTASGTSFPTSPDTGEQFFRTDLGWLCYYDGTRWLTVEEFPDFHSSIAAATTEGSKSATRIRTDYAPWFTRLAVTTLVATTNNAANYWTIKINSHTKVSGASIAILTFNTSADSADANTDHEQDVTTNNPSNYGMMWINCTKTLSPGALTAYLTLYYRLIVT
jgi:hypothetical protein